MTVGPRGTATKSSPGGAGGDVPTSEVDVLAVPDRKNNQTGARNSKCLTRGFLAQWLRGRASDSQLREPGFEY